jgi:hypothetical protein
MSAAHNLQVYDFLIKLNRRPFIKRFLRSDEIQQEIEACDKALGDAMQMFSVRVLTFLSSFAIWQSAIMNQPDLELGRYRSK